MNVFFQVVQPHSNFALSVADWITIMVGAAAVAVTVSIYFVAARVNRAQIRMQQGAVDANAYERAKIIYEGAISTLQHELNNLRAEMDRLRAANESMSTEMARVRALNQSIQDEVSRLNRTNEDLTIQVTRLHQQVNIIEKKNGN